MSLLSGMRLILSTSCDRSSRLLSDELERPLSRAERAALRLHLVICQHCRRFRRNLQNLRMMVRHLTARCISGEETPETMSAERRARIAEAVARAESEES